MKFCVCSRCLNSTDFLELSEKDEENHLTRSFLLRSRHCYQQYPAPVLVDKEIEYRFRAMPHSSNRGFKARYEFLNKEEIQRGRGASR